MSAFSVGEIVRNTITGEEGQIVRVTNFSQLAAQGKENRRSGTAYIVSLPAEPLKPAREALWRQSELEGKRGRN
jgi:hypothetical protein